MKLCARCDLWPVGKSHNRYCSRSCSMRSMWDRGVLGPRRADRCAVPGCERPVDGVAHCAIHRHRLRRTGTTDQPVKGHAVMDLADGRVYATTRAVIEAHGGRRAWFYEHLRGQRADFRGRVFTALIPDGCRCRACTGAL